MRISDSYASLVQGVSEQAPETRGPGRMTEQVNIIPDPVFGLTRRHGTMFMGEQATTLPAASMAALVVDTARMRTLTANTGVADIDILYSPVGTGTTGLPPVIAYNRTTGRFMSYARNAVDPDLDTWEQEGVGAITALGKYVLSAPRLTAAAGSSVDQWDSTPNKYRAALWVRGGAFSRTFSVTLKTSGGTTYTVSYTTPSAAYTGTLDTSDIPAFVRVKPVSRESDSELAMPTLVTEVPPWGSGTTAVKFKLSYGKFVPAMTVVEQNLDGTATTLTNNYPAAPDATHYYHAPGAEFIYFDPAALATSGGSFDRLWYHLAYDHDKVEANDSYTRLVNDRTAAYNTAVTQWLASSAAAIVPSDIATQLNAALVTAGYTGGTVTGSTITFEDVDTITADDGGDGEFVRTTANTVKAVEDLTATHYPGKVVRVQAQSNAESFYLKAVSDIGTAAVSSVTWVESGRYERAVTRALVYLYPVDGVIYAASSAALLTALISGDHPGFPGNQIGDADSNPDPYFLGRPISYLGVFQDRLLVGAGSTLSVSRTSDYLNFYRSTVVTIPASDPYSMRAEGPDDDTLRFSCIYNRDLVIFGDVRQYLIQGRIAMTPVSANMPVLSNHPDAADIPPVDAGGLLFYGSLAADRSAVSQMEPTLNVDSPGAFPISSQLNRYLVGNLVEMVPATKPTTLLVRTDGARDTVYVFQYVDFQQGRKQDAWYSVKFDPTLGAVIGVSHKGSSTLVYFLREVNGVVWFACDELHLTGGLSTKPYLDSLRPVSAVSTITSSVYNAAGEWRIAYDDASGKFLKGGSVASQRTTATDEGGAWVGCLFDAYVIPSNPVMKDDQGNANTNGTLTVTYLHVSLNDTVGLDFTIETPKGEDTYTRTGLSAGDPLFSAPISTRLEEIPVYEDAGEYTLTLAARKWYPLTISHMGWIGQFFKL